MAKRNNYMYIRTVNELPPAPSHKKRCKTCEWHGRLTGSTDNLNDVICEYFLKTGRLRPCDPKQCTVYKKKERKNDKKSKYRSDNPFGDGSGIYKPGGRKDGND